MGNFTKDLKKILRENGCSFERQGKGDHEIWYSPATALRFIIDKAAPKEQGKNKFEQTVFARVASKEFSETLCNRVKKLMWVYQITGDECYGSKALEYGLFVAGLNLNGITAAKFSDFASIHRKWIEAALSGERHKRQSRWTESVAVGDESFVKDVKDGLIGRGRGRQVVESDGAFELREEQAAYSCYENEDWNLIAWNEKS